MNHLKSKLCILLILFLVCLPVYSKDDLADLERKVKDTRYSKYWDRLPAIKKLGRIKNKKSTALLIELLGDREPPIREAAVMALSNLDDADLIKWFCEQALCHPKNPEIRANAAWVLRLLKDPECFRGTLPYLTKALRDREPRVVVESLRAIALLPNANTAEDTILKALSYRSSEVRAAAAYTLGTIKLPEAEKQLLKRLKDSAWQVRAAAIEALASINPEASLSHIIKGLKNSKSQVRMVALETLLKVDKDEALKAAIDLLNHKDWPVRACAIEVLRQIKHKDCLDPLIQHLSKEKTRLRYDIICVLDELTGKFLGYQAKAWQDWFNANKENIEIASGMYGGSHPDPGETIACFFDIPIFGKNVIFIIDFSGSMIKGPKSDKREIDIAQEELAKALKKFTRDMRFNIIIMSTEAKRIKKRGLAPRLLPATEKNKKFALDFVANTCDYLEDIKRGRGDMYDALMEAFADPHTDTIFLLSDGVPTYGQYIVEENILENLERENRFRRIMINTILTVKTGLISEELMSKIAQLTRGTFTKR